MSARRAALLRLLEDWEAGRMTPPDAMPTMVHYMLYDDGLIAFNGNNWGGLDN